LFIEKVSGDSIESRIDINTKREYNIIQQNIYLLEKRKEIKILFHFIMIKLQ